MLKAEVTAVMINHTPVRPRSTPQTRPFDLSEIDTPEEAMVMPGADLWAGLVLGPLAGRVSVMSGDQVLQYEIEPSPDHLTYKGTLNGQPFELEGRAARPRGIQVTGETPGGAVDSLRRGGGGGFGLDGSVGEVEFSQLLALDRGGHGLAYLAGTLDGEEFEARARKGENRSVEVEGHLGDQPLHQTIRLGPNQEWIISGEVGDHHYTQMIERF